MTAGPQSSRFADGRLHLSHGPIDLIIEAFGAEDEVAASYEQARTAFAPLLATLVEELAQLKQPLSEPVWRPKGPVAQRMVAACWPLRHVFLTPMAAVAGAVADHVLAAMMAGRCLTRAYVNDGGDIAFHLSPGETLTAGLVADLSAPALDGRIALTADLPVRGLATSGRLTKGQGGKSFSFGIADAVTVLARDGAAADAAATLIANAVDLDHPEIARAPAASLDPDSDLGERLVTVGVGTLDAYEIDAALARGAARAQAMRQAGHIYGAVLVLRRHFMVVGPSDAFLTAA